MNVGVGFFMGSSERDGIGWSITYLLHQLLRLGSRHSFTLYTNLPAEQVSGEFGHPPNLRVATLGASGFTRWEQILLPQALRRDRIDLFHSPLGLPLLSGTPGIATIHDVCFMSCPETFTRRMRVYFRTFLPLSVRKARLVVTVSGASRDALIQHLGVPAEKIRVVPNGIAEHFRPVRDPGRLAGVRGRYGLPDAFILYAGTLEPRKNVMSLLRAFRLLREEGRIKESLVIVGKSGWLSDEVPEFVRRSGLADLVHLAGYVAREDLPAVYSAARLFVYPSVCEGFGLPPLEAMACGTPVVASNVSAMPEVLGSAAQLVAPHDVPGLAAAIEAMLNDERLRERQRADGLGRAATYRWDRAAREMLQVYEEATARPA
jgi:glycosyltransferase involved in cell wall biosynthesis